MKTIFLLLSFANTVTAVAASLGFFPDVRADTTLIIGLLFLVLANQERNRHG